VDFVHQHDGPLAVHAPSVLGRFDQLADVLDASHDGADGIKVGPGAVGDDHGQGGLACAGRTPEDDGREEAVGFDGPAQQPSFAHDVFLPHKLFQPTRSHPRCQGSLALDLFLATVFKEVHSLLGPSLVAAHYTTT